MPVAVWHISSAALCPSRSPSAISRQTALFGCGCATESWGSPWNAFERHVVMFCLTLWQLPAAQLAVGLCWRQRLSWPLALQATGEGYSNKIILCSVFFPYVKENHMEKCPAHMYQDFWTPAALRIIVLNLYLILKLATSISDQWFVSHFQLRK